MRGDEAVDIAEILRRNQLLGVLDRREMAELVGLGHVVQYDGDALIFDKGDPGDCLYAVLKGQIGIHTSSADGKTMILNFLEAGAVLGEIALIDGKPRTAGATAKRPSELFRIDRATFIPFLERHPRLAIRLLGVLCDRLRWVSENIEDAVFHDVPRRLARKLLLLAETYGQPTPAGLRITQGLSQENLASMLGVTREMVNKSLKALKTANAITYTKGFLVLTNIALVRDMAGEDDTSAKPTFG